MDQIKDLASQMLLSIHAIAKKIGDNKPCGILSQIDLSRFANIDENQVKHFANVQHVLFSIAPLKSGIANSTGLTTLINTIVSEQYEPYANKLSSYYAVESETRCKNLSDIHFISTALLTSLHQLAKTNPDAALINLMCTKHELTEFKNLNITQLLKFCNTGIIPFVFASSTGEYIVRACESNDFNVFHRHIDMWRACTLSALI